MRLLASLFVLFCALFFANAIEARERCGCTIMPAFSTAETGECKVLENRKPSCHLNWYDLRNISKRVVDAYESMHQKIVKVHSSERSFEHLEGMNAPRSHLEDNKKVRSIFERNNINPKSIHYALGYLGFTDPQQYKVKPLIQSVALLLSIDIKQYGEEAVKEFLGIINHNAKFLHRRISGNADAGAIVRPKHLKHSEKHAQDTVKDYSRYGCVDLRFQDIAWAQSLTAMLLKSRKSLPDRARC